ncbi:rhodanese-like domain-containing protein [Endozoicomonas sp.]|uniref:rhodanese-like domain-containing protein n=1 Tax=Endozoicomonas sp. TaxID=1892382 RepID=UPI00288670BA|nr:rhodanese-like domain-containing protein [Endozoicomonas sp.]
MRFFSRLLAFLFISVFLFIPLSAFSEDAFPYRSDYADVKVMELSDLLKEYEDVLIVDVRSSLEFDVIHMTRAMHVPMSTQGFENEVKDLHSEGVKVVAYCNGHTCKKSYKAVRRLMKAGINEVYAFDAGIFDWAKANPDKTVLMGESPVESSKLIPGFELKKHFLDSYGFFKQAKSKGDEALLIDVRDNFQIAGTERLKDARAVPFDRFQKWLEAGNGKNKTIFVVDAVGKQVRWLQYYLIKYGYTNYFFLEGGVASLK